MNNGIGMMINGVVAILLVLTIGYCMLLNRRLSLLKSDEHSLRATISELVMATDIAEFVRKNSTFPSSQSIPVKE